ncbi:hypothetical protein ACFLXA_05450 [Chloroflexota bacterium]
MSIFSIFAMWSIGALIKANLKAYFYSIASGASHEDALARVLKSRYPLSRDKREHVAESYHGRRIGKAKFSSTKPATQEDAEKDELQDLIFTMYEIETHLDRVDTFQIMKEEEKFDDKFNEIYDSMKHKYL